MLSPGLCLIWFGTTIFSLRSHPPLFHNFQHFNFKVPAGGAGFYSSVFVVPKHTGGLHPILNLEHFNCFMHIPSFKMPTLKTVRQLIQHGDYAFSIDLQDAYLHVPIVKHHRQFLHFVLHIVIYLDDILVLVHSKWAGKRAHLFLCSLLVHLGLHINFSKSDLCLSQSFTFFGIVLGYCGIVSTSWYLYLLIS